LRLGLAVLCCALLQAASARADLPEIEIARGHSRRGAKLYEAGKSAQAAAEFELARREMPIAELDYNLGRCYEGTGDIDAALEAYRRYLTRPLSPQSRDEISDRVRLLEAASPRAHERAQNVRQHERLQTRWRRFGVAATAVGALAIGSGVTSGALYAHTRALRDELALGCPPQCDVGLYDRAKASNTAASALFGIAITAAAVDVALWGVALNARQRAHQRERAR
jgi:hypothetical protein